MTSPFSRYSILNYPSKSSDFEGISPHETGMSESRFALEDYVCLVETSSYSGYFGCKEEKHAVTNTGKWTQGHNNGNGT